MSTSGSADGGKRNNAIFMCSYAMQEEYKAIVEKEMNKLENLNLITKDLGGSSSTVLLVKRKYQNLHKVCRYFDLLSDQNKLNIPILERIAYMPQVEINMKL